MIKNIYCLSDTLFFPFINRVEKLGWLHQITLFVNLTMQKCSKQVICTPSAHA